MHKVDIEEDFLTDTIKVRVDGVILKDNDGNDRTFKNTFEAGLEGAREVDRRRDRGKTFITDSPPNGACSGEKP